MKPVKYGIESAILEAVCQDYDCETNLVNILQWFQ